MGRADVVVCLSGDSLPSRHGTRRGTAGLALAEGVSREILLCVPKALNKALTLKHSKGY